MSHWGMTGRNRKVMLPLARPLMKPLLDHTVWSQQKNLVTAQRKIWKTAARMIQKQENMPCRKTLDKLFRAE